MRLRIASILAMIVCFIICISQIWKHVPDPTIDFGREIYVAWRVSEGEPLYTHLTYINGPLSPYLNAAVFKIAGPSLNVLKWFNCFIAAIDLTLIYLLCRKLSDAPTAAVCGISWCVLFAFGIFLNDPTFNFITPYSHDLTHGFTLAMGMMLMLSKAFLPRPVLGARAGERGEAIGSETTSPSSGSPLTPTLCPKYKGEGAAETRSVGVPPTALNGGRDATTVRQIIF